MSSPLAANTVDAAALADELARFRVLEPTRLTELLSEFSGGGSVALVEFLVWRGALTPYQADRALAGASRALALGPYRLTGLAGRGTFGPIHAAIHRDKPGEFRLHVFPLRSLWRARQAKQLARTLAVAQHPAIVPLLDADSANGFHYLVWPQTDGELLGDRVAATGPLAPGEVAGLLAHLAHALRACHIRKIVHGTLTPQTIVLGPDGLPRLLEIGAGMILAANLADEESLLDTLSQTVATTGVLEFAAPEFAANPTELTPAADQYALGAIGYFALTGQSPFPFGSLTDRLASKLSGPPHSLDEVNPTIPPELASVIDRMLRPAPGDRFPGLDEVQDRLATVAGLPESIDNPSATTDPPSPEYLPLSVLHDPGRSGGSISFHTPGTEVAFLPTRDDSEASITFELPVPIPDPEPPRNNSPHDVETDSVPGLPASPPDTPSRAELETQPSSGSMGSRKNRSGRSARKGLEANSDSPATFPDDFNVVKTSPATRTSPDQPEDQHVAKPSWSDPFDGHNGPILSPKPRPEFCNEVATPVHYHTEVPDEEDTSPGPTVAPSQQPNDRPVTDSVLWKKVKRNLLFWQTPMDVLWVSVFGPAAIAPGQPAKVSVYVHSPEATDSVRTLSRAFHHDSELIGGGYVAREVPRDTLLGVHLSVANAGVTKSLFTFVWRGQPQRLVFDLHVPWESPGGPAPGLVSIGRDNVRIGKIEFRLTLLPRKG